MTSFEVLAEEVLHLPVDQRSQLAERLLESLDHLPEEEVERLWTQEAHRRYVAHEAGDVESRSAESVHAALLKRVE